MYRKTIIFLFLAFTSVLIYAQDTLYLDLESSKKMAENNNRLIKIFQYKIENSEGQLSEMKSNYFPRVVAEGTFGYNSDPNIHVYKGEFNHIYDDLIEVGWIDEMLKEYFPLPPKDMILVHGDEFFYETNVSVYQPLSQLTQVNTGRKVAETDLKITRIKKEDVVSEIKLGVTELFYGILLESKKLDAAGLEIKYKEAEYQDVFNAWKAGEILEIDVKALEAEIHEKEQELIQIRNKWQSYLLSFRQLTGLDDEMEIALMPVQIEIDETADLSEILSMARQNNYDLRIADLTMQKASLGIMAAKKEYIPELTYFMQYNYNHGIPLNPDAYFLTGLNLKWNIFSSGERKALVKQRNALHKEAVEDFEYERQTVRNEVEKGYLNLSYAKKLIETARLALQARKEEVKLISDAVEEGESLPTRLIKAKSDLAKAEADVLGAQLNYLIVKAKLKRLKGEI